MVDELDTNPCSGLRSGRRIIGFWSYQLDGGLDGIGFRTRHFFDCIVSFLSTNFSPVAIRLYLLNIFAYIFVSSFGQYLYLHIYLYFLTSGKFSDSTLQSPAAGKL